MEKVHKSTSLHRTKHLYKICSMASAENCHQKTVIQETLQDGVFDLQSLICNFTEGSGTFESLLLPVGFFKQFLQG